VHSQSIGYLLNYLTDLEAIRVRVDRLAAMQQALSAALPGELARLSRVGYETQGTLVLLAGSGVAAARLRHLVPRLLFTIRKQFAEVKAIRIEVQLVRDSRRGKRPVRRIGATGQASLQDLEARLAAGPLRCALQRLLEHQASSDGDDQPLQEQERSHDERDG
jgi:hypothetical protein